MIFLAAAAQCGGSSAIPLGQPTRPGSPCQTNQCSSSSRLSESGRSLFDRESSGGAALLADACSVPLKECARFQCSCQAVHCLQCFALTGVMSQTSTRGRCALQALLYHCCRPQPPRWSSRIPLRPQPSNVEILEPADRRQSPRRLCVRGRGLWFLGAHWPPHGDQEPGSGKGRPVEFPLPGRPIIHAALLPQQDTE